MLKTRYLWQMQQRWKSKRVRNQMKQQNKNINKALENFDDFYGNIFGIRWKNMRAALLTKNKHIAMVNIFADVEKTCQQLEMMGAMNISSLIQAPKASAKAKDTPTNMECTEDDHKVYKTKELQHTKRSYSDVLHAEYETELEASKLLKDNYSLENRLIDLESGSAAMHEYLPATQLKGMEDWIPESQHYGYYNITNDFPLNFEPEYELNFEIPNNMFLYTFEKGNCSRFPTPRKHLTGVLSHLILDGASIMPPLCLNVNAGDRVLDVCAAPGGKSLLMLQTLQPHQLICNDSIESRINRLRKLMREYLCDYETNWLGKRLFITRSDARRLSEYGTYDKILVDVPCTADRHSVCKNDNNIFKSTRIKERLRIPELQSEILTNSLRLLKPGGSLVYSTCTLSPVQNDGVVHMALQKAFVEYNLVFTIKNLCSLVNLFGNIFHFEHSKNLRYGQMIIPYLHANFGPMYFCKITRNITNI